MKIKNILISQPEPPNGSAYSELISKYKLNIDFIPFFRVDPISSKEFRTQKVNILDYTAIVFTAKTAIDAFFKLCEELRIAVPESMKYFCSSEAIAHYLQKYIVYRKRKIFFGNGTLESIVESIGTKHKSESFLISTADNLKTDLHKHFTNAKLKHNMVVLIKTVNSELNAVNLSNYDMVVFYSPSDLKSLQENFPDFDTKSIQFATFGPLTTKAVKAAKINPTLIAPTPEAPSISRALAIYLEQK